VFVPSQYFRFVARAAERRRSPLLEQLLARADHRTPVTDWRADAFRVIAPSLSSMPGVAAAALCAVDTAAVDTATVDAAWVCAATPVHYAAEMTTVRMSADGVLSLQPNEAESLASDFNRVWAGSGIRMTAARTAAGTAQLFCVFDRALDVATCDPEDVSGRHLEEFLPAGEDAARLKRLMSETEMWLFEHEANRIRTELLRPTISGLWFWGGGASVAALPSVQGWAAGDDLFFDAFNRSRDEKYPSGVVAAVCAPGSDQWHTVEARWLRPAVEDLRARRISRLQLSAADRCFTVTARGLRRFWRRTKPWWESFE
jgi:hypothetical protein